MMNAVMGIDVGTQSTKIIVYDYLNKKNIAESSSPHELIAHNDGTREQKAEWWIEAFKKCISKIPAPIIKSVEAIGVSGQQHGFVPLDKDGNVIYNVKLWCDTSTQLETEQINSSFKSEEDILNECGNIILPGYTASKILWLKNHEPELYNKMAKVLLPHDYINYFLTGVCSMEYGDASGTGLLDIKNRCWNKKIINSIDSSGKLHKCLPDIKDSLSPIGKISHDIAKIFGFNEDVIVSAGGGDNMMGAIGTGCVKEGKMTMSLGTSGTLFGCSKKPIINKNLAAFCSSTNNWLPLLCTMNCTVGLELTKNLFKKNIAEINDMISQTSPSSGGVITLPFYNGERAPNLPNGKGCIFGLTPNNMKEGNIIRSSMESAVYGIKYGLNNFIESGFSPTEIIATGGGAKSSTWCQMASDILNISIKTVEIEEAAAFGAALQALAMVSGDSIEKITDIHVKVSEAKKYYPDKDNVKIYNACYKEYLEYLALLTPKYI